MQESATKEKAEVELLKLHPDFVDIREDDDFHNWAEEQPQWVQKALYENDNDANLRPELLIFTKLIKILARKRQAQRMQD